MKTNYKIINGYPTIEIYGLTIRTSHDGRLEIDLKEEGNTVNRLYLQPDDNGMSVRTHTDSLSVILPYKIEE